MTQWLSLLCVVEVTVGDDEIRADTTVGIVGFDSVTGADNSSCTDVAAVATMFWELVTETGAVCLFAAAKGLVRIWIPLDGDIAWIAPVLALVPRSTACEPAFSNVWPATLVLSTVWGVTFITLRGEGFCDGVAGFRITCCLGLVSVLVRSIRGLLDGFIRVEASRFWARAAVVCPGWLTAVVLVWCIRDVGTEFVLDESSLACFSAGWLSPSDFSNTFPARTIKQWLVWWHIKPTIMWLIKDIDWKQIVQNKC